MLPLGVTTDPGHGLTVGDVRRAGFSYGRIVLRWHQDPTPFLTECAAQGVPLIGVWTSESRAPGMDDWTSAVMWLGWLKRTGLLPVIKWLQIGNEPDLVSESSWTMGHDEFNAMVAAVAPVFAQDCIIVGGGLAGGHPEWLDGVDQTHLDLIAVHPYGRAPNNDPLWLENMPEWSSEVTWFLTLYQDRTSLPLAISEYGGRDYNLGSYYRRYVTEMTQTLLGLAGSGQLAFVCLFCLSDLMVPGMGALYGDGKFSPAGRGVRSLGGPA
jgi:hypothetical protein